MYIVNCLCKNAYVRAYVCMYVRMYVRMYVCIPVCILSFVCFLCVNFLNDKLNVECLLQM